MCGRYSLALRPSQVRRMLEQDDNLPVWEAPADEGDDAPRQSYNFAPGYHGIVYRADVPDWGAGPRRGRGTASEATSRAKNTEGPVDTGVDEEERGHEEGQAQEAGAPGTGAAGTSAAEGAASGGPTGGGEVHYKLQSMKWGLVPFWTKRNPDYGAMLKTINCRDDSLAAGGGMWSTMKARKRCIVVAQGFYEWLKVGKDKVPHFVKRKDGHLMCLAGLWDCVQYEDDIQKHYTYTIITTDSNKQLKFLHDRMPVILDAGSEKMRKWLDPSRHEWSKELQDVLKPYDGELEVYPVSKDVGKVGNNSPSFIIPIASKENKSNIANFFANAKSKKDSGSVASTEKLEPEVEVVKTEKVASRETEVKETKTADKVAEEADDGGMSALTGTKRRGDEEIKKEEPTPKKLATKTPSPSKLARGKISATSNGTKSPSKSKTAGTQKITKFFSNSS
ncbi:YoqW [Pleurostoma richardsiae]|uniref:YoqW n=1 Tax=Pleurostoma richardsiae TaxID=41990 RepID=A0AA38S578_9PEZI|nr:YoqW [Pleurostoma richardsiae]